MAIKDWQSSLSACFKVGLMSAIPFGIIFFVVIQIWTIVNSYDLSIVGNIYLNFSIKLAILTAMICAFGWLFQRPRLRNFAENIFKKLPVISWIFSLFPSSDQLDKFKSGDYPEVLVEISPGVYLRGLLVKEKILVNGKELCRVLIPTTPVPITGNLLEVEKEKLIFTGRTAKETSRTYLSLGMQ